MSNIIEGTATAVKTDLEMFSDKFKSTLEDHAGVMLNHFEVSVAKVKADIAAEINALKVKVANLEAKL
jgi:uncharacterized protein YceH (UPF0502 family)